MTNDMNVKVMSELEITTAALAVGWVKFSYYKADGTKRIAIGTTNRALIDQVRGYRMAEYRENKTYYANHGYFDLSRCDWRQFNENRFIGLELSRLTNEDAVKIAITISYADSVNNRTEEERAHLHNLLRNSERLVSHRFVVEIYNIVSSTFVEQDPYRSTISNEDIDGVIAVLHISAKVEEKPKDNRAELIAELKKLRQRESEILAILLG